MSEIPLSETRRRQLAAKASRAEGIPIETLLSFTDENLRAAARDFSPTELEERMRDTESGAYGSQISCHYQVFALIEFLATRTEAELQDLSRDLARATELLSRDYLVCHADVDHPPDSAEAAEGATTDARNLAWARQAWVQLTPIARASLLEIFDRAAGKAAVGALVELLGSN